MWYCVLCCTGGSNFQVKLLMKPWCVTIQMKAIEQYFHVVLFIMQYKVLLPLNSVDELIPCVTVKLLVEGSIILTRLKHLTLPTFCCLSRAS